MRAQLGAEDGDASHPARLAKRRLRGRFVGSRWARVVALALVLGVALGFGLASWLTPSGSATSSFVGFGFLPVKGWTVMQGGTVGATGAATAVAANVPLHPDDGLADPPYATLESLPSGGILIFARFTTRGDPAEDANFTARTLPLEIESVQLLSPSSEPLPLAHRLTQYRLRAGVGGYNVDARVYFGAVPASAGMIRAAQRQLSRLVVASERVTIAAQSSVVGLRPSPYVRLFGSVASGRRDEVVTIQAKECGPHSNFFTAVASARTGEGGRWSTDAFIRTTTAFRAMWADAASAEVTVRVRATVRLN